MKKDKYEVDLRDLLAQLLYKAKWILIVMLIGMIVAAGFWKHTSVQVANEQVTDEDIDGAKKVLAAEQIDQVEYLYAQYLSYVEYRKSLQKYLSDSLYSDDDYDGNVGMTVLYFVDSDIKDVNQIFARLTLNDDIYEEIASVLGRSSQMMDDVYRRVSISNIQGDTSDSINVTLDSTEADETKKTILQVYLIAENKEQADQISEIIDKSIRKNLERLRSVDEGIKLSYIGNRYTSNIAGYIDSRQGSAISMLNSINDQISNHQINYVDKLESEEKSYYELLKKRDELNADHPLMMPSLPKYLIIGMFLGAVLSVCWLMFKYILDGTIKTAGDMRSNSNEEPVVIYKKLPKVALFGKLARLLVKPDPSDDSVQTAMSAADLAILLQKKDASSVYFIYDDETDSKHHLNEELRTALAKKAEGITVNTGNPLSDVSELETFSKAQVAVLLVQLKKDRRNAVKKWMQLCSRYAIPVIRTIAVEEC